MTEFEEQEDRLIKVVQNEERNLDHNSEQIIETVLVKNGHC